MTCLLDNCFFYAYTEYAYTVCLTEYLIVCLTVCLYSMSQYALTQYPTHSILQSMPLSMPHSKPSQYASVCLHTDPHLSVSFKIANLKTKY